MTAPAMPRTTLTREQVAELVDIGRVDLTGTGDQWVTWRVEDDDGLTIEDCEDPAVIGHLHYTSDPREQRPAGFDGTARKIQYGRGDWAWWQPPVDVTTREDRDGLAAWVRDRLGMGYVYVVVQRWETVEDSRGQSHAVEVDTAGLGGIDTLEDGYAVEVAADLLSEVGVDVAEVNQ